MLNISPRPGSKSFWIGCLRVVEVPGRKILKLLDSGLGCSALSSGTVGLSGRSDVGMVK
jgi:hypothetical protein